jgi:2-keto-4-pentenoate hydratase
MVERLLVAHRDRSTAPVLHDVVDVDDTAAYLIQRRVFEARFGTRADAVRGYKISLTTPRDQRALKTDAPLYGWLAEQNLVPSPARISIAGMFCPIIEPEVVFRFDEDLSPAASPEEIVANSHLAAAFDLPDSRYANWPDLSEPTATDLIADNACIGLIVYAEPSVRAAAVDLPNVLCTMTVDGREFGSGRCSFVSGSPVLLVAWLSRKLAEHGHILRKGELVSSGAVIAPSPLKRVEPGSYRAEFARIGTVGLDVE